MNKRVAIIRIAGQTKLNKQVKYTFSILRLYKKNTCVIIKNTPSKLGMIKKLKDFITWGELDEKTFKILLEKRGRIIGNKPLTNNYIQEKSKLNLNDFINEFMECKKELKDVPGLKQFFRLSPPRKGFEKKGTKHPFSLGGSLGYRKEKINELIQRMI